MAELADALGSGPSGRKAVEVRVLLSAPVLSRYNSLADVENLHSAVETAPLAEAGPAAVKRLSHPKKPDGL